MFCKKCGNDVADNATFCNKCGAPVAATAAAAPVAAPTGLNLKELILKGVSALFFLLTLIFYSGNTLVASAWGMSQAGPMAGALESGEGGFVNTIAIIIYVISLVLAVLSLAMTFIGNVVPAGVSKFFGKKVALRMVCAILSIVVYMFGFIACLGMAGGGMNISFSGLGIFNLILHIAQIVVLVLISKECKKSK